MKTKGPGWIVRLVFTIIGSIYTVLGVGFLVYAVIRAGELARIFSLPEDDLAMAVIGAVFTLMGVIFLLIVGILLVIDRRSKKMREELLAYGTRVKGIVTEVRIDQSVRMNRRSPYRAKVRCTLPLGETTLRSPQLWAHVPAVGEEVTVLFDPMDERRHVIEFPGET